MNIQIEENYKISLDKDERDLLVQGLFGQHASDSDILKRLENDWNTKLNKKEANIKTLIVNPIFKKDTKKKSTEKKKKKKKSSTLKK